ncbi:MAG: ATP-binding protein [Rhodospirillaceae bacterium]
MKRVFPDSLGSWVFTVVATAVILIYGSLLIVSLIFRDGQAAAVASSQAADQLIVLKRVIEQAEPQSRRALIRNLNSPGLRMVITSSPFVRESDDEYTSRIVFRRLEREFPLGTDIRTDSRIVESTSAERFPPPPPPPLHQLQRQRDEREQRSFRTIDRALQEIRGFQPFVRASIKVGDNYWLNARMDLDLSEVNQRTQSFFLLTAVITLLITGLAIWAVRRATMPVSLFATAAERLGIGLDAESLPESGTGEVRRAARAFNTMQARLKRFIQDRTEMLAAISHDLRTPITRMRLRAEFVEGDEHRERMLADLDEMESMISSTLTFARDDAAKEPATRTDIAATVRDIVEDQIATGMKVTYEGPDSLERSVRPMGLKRAFNNLVENAVKYGDYAQVSLRVSESQITLIIDDNGPGIPDGAKEKVFAPFFRLESSRSRDTGGTGLGMTSARNAVRSMGGDIELLDLDGGGLRVRVSLPLES